MASVAPKAEAKPASASERALKRERAARERAEKLLEDKSRDLYLANEDLKAQHERIARRNEEIEKAHASLKSAQAQLVQSEKLATVGQLAAGVAHEINNPIGFIMSNLGTLKSYSEVMAGLIAGYRKHTEGESPEPDSALAQLRSTEESEDIDYILEDIVELVSESLDGTKRVKEIVQGLKSFSRIDDSAETAADLNEGLDATLKVVANELKYNCDVVKNYGELPLVPCTLAQLNQVFMNLLVNAAHAMEEHGTITISTRTEEGFAVVEVRDTGKGIPEDKIGSIFDPFFTTKPVGSGTGLGLSISYGIIEDHGGDISVESEVGVGTTFTIRLPLAGKGKTTS